MRLTRQTNYAIRILMYCGANQGNLSRIPEIASAYGLSELFLFKILQPLVEHKLVETVRGRNGGVKLGRPADQITLFDVVRVTEDNFAMAECFETDSTDCPLVDSCALNEALRQDPGRTSVRLRLVEALLANGHLEEAERQARELPQNSQIAPLMHKLLGDIHYRRQQFQLAVEEYRATVLHLPDHEQLLSDLERELVVSEGDWEELAEELQPSIATRVADETRRLRQNRRNRNRRA